MFNATNVYTTTIQRENADWIEAIHRFILGQFSRVCTKVSKTHLQLELMGLGWRLAKLSGEAGASAITGAVPSVQFQTHLVPRERSGKAQLPIKHQLH